jgi:ABC-type nickel/cobalt efflux system permease component RcnA
MTAAILLTALGLGLRHGVDWDHIAAITDISYANDSRSRGFLLSMVYALGHALVVIVLGAIVIAFGATLPTSIDQWMSRFVGLTLLLLGATVLYQLTRDRRDFQLRSRWMLVISGTFAGVRRIRALGNRRVIHIDHMHDHEHGSEDHEADHAHDHAHVGVASRERVVHGSRSALRLRGHGHAHSHELAVPDRAFTSYGGTTAAGIGMLHGVSVESPTQIAVFIAATSAGGRGAGFALLTAWVVGLLVANTGIAGLASWGVLHARESRAIYLTIATIVALSSLVLGALLVGGYDALPEILPT